jgi:hypothetical protein
LWPPVASLTLCPDALLDLPRWPDCLIVTSCTALASLVRRDN